ncbi:ABC transporter substrate-binding protein [Sinosporangium siamense]|uniref:Solute-binding protein n=2 Tax=Sinosporangium siamense TaxID=1367973 RepID=A0A919V9K6_9ACTN|nr:extracellular solute-binding protein [Sinosporangium siamense]GII95538.1 solute-binding protein [Sinosporangium siamense]
MKAALIAGSTAMALMLSGCGLGSGQVADADLNGQIEGTITFQTMQLSPTFDDYINGLIKRFEAEHPNTTVKWTDIPSDQTARKVSADAAAGSLPDVMDLDSATLAPLGRDGRVVDMADAAGGLKEDYVASAWNSFDYGDVSVAALPWYVNSPVLLANSALVTKAGSPATPTTYSELLDVSAKIAKESGKAGFQPESVRFPDYLLSVGVPLVNEDSTKARVNTAEAHKFVQKLADLYASGGIPADSVTAAPRAEIDTFSQGATVYLETGASRLKILKENAPAVYDAIAVEEPMGAADGKTWVVAHGLAVPKSSKNAATALAFAKFVTNAQNQLALAQQSAVFPSAVKALNDPFFTAKPTDAPTEARKMVAKILFDGRTTPKPPAVDAEYATTLWASLQSAITGEVPVADALAAAETRLTEMLQKRSK